MSNATELVELAAQLNKTKKGPTAVATLGAMAGTIADFAGAAGAVGPLVSLVLSKMGEGNTELRELRALVERLFNRLNQHQKAQDITVRFTNLDNQLAPAQAALDTLEATLNSNPSPAERIEAIKPCVTALEALNNTVWFAPVDDQVYWNDSFDNVVDGQNVAYCHFLDLAPQPDESNNVFSYTSVLPYYLKALAIFLAVAKALDQNFVVHFGDSVLKPARDLLLKWHDKIVREGVVELAPFELPFGVLGRSQERARSFSPLPSAIEWTGEILSQVELASVFTPRRILAGVTPEIREVTIEYGAVEKFSGHPATGTYLIKIGTGTGMVSISSDPGPRRKFLIRLLKKVKEVYVGVGMLSVWTVINHLNALLGTPALSRPNGADWSFRAISNIVGPTSLKDIKRFLQATPPNDTPSEALTPVGFRALLEV